MKKALSAAVILAGLSSSLMAEGLSDGSLDLSLSVIRTDTTSLIPAVTSTGDGGFINLVSAPVRVGYKVNDQFTLFGGVSLASNTLDDGTDETSISARAFTGGVTTVVSSGITLEGSLSLILFNFDDGTNDVDFSGNHFEALAGRRFELMSGLYVEPKAGFSFGSVEFDENGFNFTASDGFGTHAVVTLGYSL